MSEEQAAKRRRKDGVERQWVSIVPHAEVAPILRVATWNILEQGLCQDKNLEYVKKHEAGAEETCRWEHRCPLIVNEIGKHDPDVIAFQEVNCVMFQDLMTEFARTGYTGLHARSEKENQTDTAVFWRARLEVVSVQIGLVEDTRNAIAVVFNCEEQYVVFACTHPGWQYAKHTTIAEQVLDLAKRARNAAQLEPGEAPIVMCGDFNAGPKGEMFQHLTKDKGLRDAYMSHEEKAFRTGSRFTYGKSVLDFMFHSPALEVVGLLQMDRKAVFQGHNCIPHAEFPSDHVPLMCDFKWVDAVILRNGIYTLESVNAKGEYLTVEGAGTKNKTPVIINSNPGSSETRWRIQKVDGDVYTLENVNAEGKHLNVKGAGTKNKTPVIIYSNPGSSETRWRIQKVDGDVYTLENVNAEGKYLNVKGAGTKNKTPVHIYSNPESSETRWRIHRVGS